MFRPKNTVIGFSAAQFSLIQILQDIGVKLGVIHLNGAFAINADNTSECTGNILPPSTIKPATFFKRTTPKDPSQRPLRKIHRFQFFFVLCVPCPSLRNFSLHQNICLVCYLQVIPMRMHILVYQHEVLTHLVGTGRIRIFPECLFHLI